MRTESEMIELILNIARADERIRAVRMEGSRANPAAPKDKYQDYDITCNTVFALPLLFAWRNYNENYRVNASFVCRLV